jgi:hypothetical protein
VFCWNAQNHTTGDIREVSKDGRTFDLDRNEIKRFGFHTFRQSLASFLMAEGENPAVTQATLRHTRLDMTMYDWHARKQQKGAAQGMVLETILARRGPPTGAGGNEAVIIVGRELVYNDKLTA